MVEDAHGGGDHMHRHGHVHAQWQGAMDQGVQGWGLNDARNMLGFLCREMVGIKLNEA